MVLLQEGAGGIAALWMYQCWSTFARLHNTVTGYNYTEYKSFCLPSPWLQYRNAVFTLWPITESECIQTPKVSAEGARTATMVESGAVDIVSVHLSSDCDNQGRLQEMQAIHPLLSQAAIIGGDFNCGVGSPVWNYLSDMGFTVVGIGVDAVAVRGFEVSSCQAVLPGVSDHPGVLVEIG
jgi:endonuclease/exonuclease/phosphatase family metal-dependent hydrolase